MERAVWNEVSTDFDPEEETANFGTRHALETGDNLYEVVTLATVEPSGVVRSLPRVRLVATGQHVVAAVDNSLIIFSSNCSEATPLVFQHPINTFAISSCCRFLTAGLQNGSMQFVHLVQSRVLSGQQVCPGRDEEEGPTFTSSLYAPDGQGKSKLVLCRYDGHLYTFSQMELELFHTAILAGDMETIRTSQSRIVGSEEDVGTPVTDCTELDSELVLATDTGLMRDLQSGDFLPLAGCVKLVVSKTDPSLLLCLDQEGKLHTICPFTLITLHTWTLNSRDSRAEVIQDIVLLEDEGGQEVQLLVVTADKMREENFLLILDFPSYKTVYRLAVSGFTRLVETHLSQTPLVLEGGMDDVLQPDLVTRLRLRGVTEGVPEARLARLLKKCKFDEAERFAESFSLDKEQVYKAKSVYLLNFLSPWKAEDPAWPHDKVLDLVKTCLDKMTDSNYVVEFCVTAAVPSLVMTRDLITFARKKIASSEEEVMETLLLRVGNTLHRLETFTLAVSQADSDIDQWLDFMRASMLKTVKNFVSRGDLSRAQLVWVRHQAEFREMLEVETVRDLLERLDDTLSYTSLLPWLQQFIPDSLRLVPACLPAVAAWAVEAVTKLELSHRTSWPLSGLSLARAVLTTMTFSRNQATDFSQFMSMLTLNQQRIEPESPLSQLVSLIKALEDLLVLHKQFRIKLKLAEFTDPVRFNVISLILDWVNSSKEISALMDGFLLELLHRWEMDVNKTLTEYIVSILDNTSFTWHWHIGAAPWEEKVSSLVQYITNIEHKSAVILEALKNAPVPWSEMIQELSSAGGKLQHEKSALIKEQTSLVEVKAVLRKYDCKSYVTSGRQAERLLLLLMKKGGEEGYEDALKVTKIIGGKTELEIEKMFIEHLLRQEQDSRTAVKRIQKSLEINFQRGLALSSHVVDTAKMMLKLEVGEDIENCYMDVVKFISASLSSSKVKSEAVDEVRSKAETILRSTALKTEFGLRTEESSVKGGESSVTSPAYCRHLLQKFINDQIEQFSSRCEPEEEKVRLTYNKLKRLTDLLELQQEEAVAGLVVRLEKAGLMDSALRVADLVSEEMVSSELGDSLFSVLYKMTGAELVTVTQSMMRQSLTSCSPPLLPDCLELASWQRLEAGLQQERAGLERGEESVYTDWRFSHLYTDRGLPLQPHTLLPLTAACLSSLLPLVENTPLPFLPRCRVANLEIQDMDVTAPDLESLGNGVDAVESCNLLAENGQSLISELQTSGHVLLGLNALQATSSPMSVLLLGTAPEMQAKASAVVSQTRSGLVSQLVRRIVTDTRADLDLGLALVTADNKKTSLSLLAQLNAGLGFDFRKISSVALLGWKLCGLHGLSKQQDQFAILYVKACWGRKLTEMEINFKTAFNGSKPDHLEVLKKMVTHPNIEITLLLQFSKAFNISKSDVLTIYSKALLTKLDAVVDSRGQIVVHNLEEMTGKVDKCLDLINDDVVVFQHLLEMFSTVSPYNYEVLNFILKRIYETRIYKDEKPHYLMEADKILGFLLEYTRVSQPQPEHEVDWWVKERGVPFPEVGLTRLPLYSLVTLPTKEKYKLLEFECTLATYNAWRSVSKVLGLNGDNLCYYAVKNTVGSMLDKNARDGVMAKEWILHHVNKSVLEGIDMCIRSIRDREKATAASNWVVNRLPKGRDKVLASQGAEDMVLSWNRATDQEADLTGLVMFRKTRRQLETEEVLQRHGIADQTYLEFVHHTRPIELIMKLYEDPSIEKRNAAAAGNFPDINTAVENIARIHELNIVNLKHELLDRWLPLSGTSYATHDDTMADFTLDLGPAKSDASDVDEINLVRCVYMLQSGDCNLKYLLKFGFSADPSVTTSHKLRALKCLFSICSDEMLEGLTGKTADTVKQYMKLLVFLCRLENLNLPYTLRSLESCSKLSLVESVWKARKQSPEGVSLVRDLCREYEIWQARLWAGVLDQMVLLEMTSELSRSLTLLNSQPHLWNSPQFLLAWNYLLQEPFRRLLAPLTADQYQKCLEAVKLLQFCPTATDLDLQTLVEETLRLDMMDLAGMIAPYLATRPALLQRVEEARSDVKMSESARTVNIKHEFKQENIFSTSGAL